MNEIVRKRNEGEPLIVPNGEPTIKSEGKLGAIVEFPVLVDDGEGYVQKMFEKFVRPPGTRIIALQDEKIYLQKERRLETGGFDQRLPGGKVVDRFNDYKKYLTTDIPIELVLEAGHRELFEETGMKSRQMSVYKKSVCGASVTWDLYYLLAQDITLEKRIEVEAEEIVDGKWYTKGEIEQLIKQGGISEDRTVGVLSLFFLK